MFNFIETNIKFKKKVKIFGNPKFKFLNKLL